MLNTVYFLYIICLFCDAMKQMTILKGTWIGHKTGKNRNRWTKQVLEWWPRDKGTNINRPLTRSDNDIRMCERNG